MLELRDLSVDAAGSKILDCVCARALPGQVVGLLGPNGSGKSTMLRAILGLARRSGGSVLYNGLELSLLNARKRARLIAYVPQNTSQSSLFTVIECAVMGRYPYLGPFDRYTKRDFKMASEALERVGLSGFEDRIVSTLSGGEMARVSCARAITQDAPVILLDEPTAALDPKHSIAVTSMIRELAFEGKIVLVAMHDVNLALNRTDRLILLKRGRIYGDMRSRLVDEKALGGLYDIPWEIWRGDDGHRLAAIPADHSSSNINPLIS